MNGLSWFLYLADTLPKIGEGAFVLLAIIGIIGGICLAFWAVAFLSEETKTLPPWRPYIITMAILSFVMVLIPSKETIYLIAGSQAGEYVVNTPEAQEILNDIHAVIRAQLRELAGEPDQ